MKILRRIANQVLTLKESFGYGEPFGELCLREQIATYLLQSRGVKTDPNGGLYLLVKVHLKRSEEWLIERASFYEVKVYPTSIYFINNHFNEPMIKLGFSNLSCEEFVLGVKLLKKDWS